VYIVMEQSIYEISKTFGAYPYFRARFHASMQPFPSQEKHEKAWQANVLHILFATYCLVVKQWSQQCTGGRRRSALPQHIGKHKQRPSQSQGIRYHVFNMFLSFQKTPTARNNQRKRFGYRTIRNPKAHYPSIPSVSSQPTCLSAGWQNNILARTLLRNAAQHNITPGETAEIESRKYCRGTRFAYSAREHKEKVVRESGAWE
jgi:hypothetical protein